MNPTTATDELSMLAAEIHERVFTIDTHCDTPTASLMKPGWDFSVRHDFTIDGSQCDLPRLREGGMDAMVFAAYVPQAARTPAGNAVVHDMALRCLERTHAVLRENSLSCGLALTPDDALRLKSEGRRAIFLSLENAYSIGREIANVEKFHRLGIRMIGLTHMLNNDVADSSSDPRGAEWGGLSPLGCELVAECNRLGITIDASHASDDTLRELLERSRTPIILSHSGCRALCDHDRNIGDDLLRALAEKDGVIQINALPVALVNAPGTLRTSALVAVMMHYRDAVLTPGVIAATDVDFDRACALHPNPHVTLADFVRHIEHAADVAGIDHVGIGCDFDGGGMVFEGLRDVTDYPKVTRALLERGWSETELRQLWGANTLRLMRAADKAAKQMEPDGRI
jgi:membrane dipeptidase